MRRSTVLQVIKQEAELRTGFFRTDIQSGKNLALNVCAVDTDGTAADFPTIEHHVIGLSQALAGISTQHVDMVGVRHCKRMVASNPAMFFIIVFKHREIDHPEGLPTFFIQTIRFTEFAVTDLQAQGTQRVIDDLGTVGTEEDDVAVLSARYFKDMSKKFIGEVLHDRALQAFTALFLFVNLDVSQALCAVDLHKFRVGVDFRARHAGSVRHVHGHNLAVGQLGGGTEHLKFRRLCLFGDFTQFNTLNT